MVPPPKMNWPLSQYMPPCRKMVSTRAWLSLRTWIRSREWPQLQATGSLGPYTFICVSSSGLSLPGSGEDASPAKFAATFVTEHWMQTCAKLDPDVPGLNVFADGTHKLTERRILCSQNQPDEDEDSSTGSCEKFLRGQIRRWSASKGCGYNDDWRPQHECGKGEDDKTFCELGTNCD